MNVVVVGGGVIGLMTARELALAGCRVTVLERGETGKEASWAGGGIVSPLYPWRYSAPVTALSREAQKSYPGLSLALRDETGIDPELYACGLLMLDAEDARDAISWASVHDQSLHRLGDGQLQQQFLGLAAHWRAGLWMPSLANIRNPRLLKALRASLRILHVDIHEHTEVARWQKRARGVVSAVVSDGRIFPADAFVVCCGAWSRSVLSQADETWQLPIRPVHGQMLLYRLLPGELPCIVMAGGRYVIPRLDGHVLCGSTQEERGFEKSVTSEARIELEQAASLLWPELGRKKPIGHWAGLRPGTPNGIPFIGPVPGLENLWVNAGHHRNGLVLAPASARLLADLLLKRETTLDPRPYQL